MAVGEKVVVLTGSSSGIGKAAAVHLASIGYKKICLVSRSKNLLDAAAQECRKAGASKVLVLPRDLSKPEVCKDIIDNVIKHFGRLDVLINNAAYVKNNLIKARDTTEEDLLKSVHVNYVAPYLLIKYGLPHLEKTKGNILNIASAFATRSNVLESTYCASKAAVKTMTEVIAVEEGAAGVRVNALSPGAILTDALKNVNEDENEVRKRMAVAQPLGRVGEVIDMAKTIAFLISDANRNMTGANVVSDGGLSHNYAQFSPYDQIWNNYGQETHF